MALLPGCFGYGGDCTHSVGEGEDPTSSINAFVPGLSHEGNGLQLSDDLLNAFSFALSDGVAFMPCCPVIDRTAAGSVILCHVRRDV